MRLFDLPKSERLEELSRILAFDHDFTELARKHIPFHPVKLEEFFENVIKLRTFHLRPSVYNIQTANYFFQHNGLRSISELQQELDIQKENLLLDAGSGKLEIDQLTQYVVLEDTIHCLTSLPDLHPRISAWSNWPNRS